MTPRRIAAVLAEEPYRLFFPLGIVVGLLGVGLWPCWDAGWLSLYPGPAHVRLMTEGFFTAFIFGFLGTAGPRMLGTPSLRPATWSVLGIVWGGAQLASLANLPNLAEAGFSLSMLVFLGGLARRFSQRDGLPPPGFVLVAISLLGAALAAVTQMPWIQRIAHEWPAFIWIGGRRFLIDCYILLPILGAAPFFFGRFGGLPPHHTSLEQRFPDRNWTRQAIAALLTGVALLVSVGLDAGGYPQPAAVLRASVISVFVLTQIPWRYRKPVSTLARLAQISLACMILAPWAHVFGPGSRLAWKHLELIPGFQGVVVAVATWVVFAHAGKRDQCLRRWTGLRWAAILWTIAVISRMAAEWIPAIRESHLLYAALLWIVASLLWLRLLLPRLREDG